MMRIVGVIFVLAGSVTTAWAVAGSFGRRRPLDVVCAAIAPAAVLVVILGGVLLFVPGFLGQ